MDTDMLVESFSGIRGIYKIDLIPSVVEGYAHAFMRLLKSKKKNPLVVIGTDTRASGPEIKRIMTEAFVSCGSKVFDVGIQTTPAIELAVREYGADGGVIITGSHNEPEHNGWKFLDSNGGILKPQEIEGVISDYKNTVREDFVPGGRVSEKSDEAKNFYINFTLDSLGKEWVKKIKERKLKVVVDPNGGATVKVIREVLEKLGVDAIEKNMEEGVFNRVIEPNGKTLKYLSQTVREERADLGAGWDCDGDRVELIDDEGNMISGQYTLAFLVDEILSGNKNGVVVVNDATSRLVGEIAEKHGGKIVEVEVGEINIVEKMYELNSPISGEGSNGGVIIPPSRCRDGIQSLVFIMKLITRTGKKLSELYEEFPKYYTPRKNVTCNIDVLKIREGLEKKFLQDGFEIKKTGDNTGGLKIIIDENSWIWYRGSKTEFGVFRIIVDSKSEEKSLELLQRGEKIFNGIVKELSS